MAQLTRKLEVVAEGDETLMKIAFATADRVHVDQHFGSAVAFSIYGVNRDQVRLLSAFEFESLKHTESEDKLATKLELLKGCIAVYCTACGSSAISQLLECGIQPVKVSENAVVQNLLIELQQELREGPSAWLAKAISRNQLDGERFNEMESDVWNE